MVADAEILLRLTLDEVAELVNLAAEETMRHRNQMLVLGEIHSKLIDATAPLIQKPASGSAAGRGIGERQHCHICGKELSDPVSIARGIGPECWQDILSLANDDAEPAESRPLREVS